MLHLEIFPPLSSETSCFTVSGKHPSPIRCNCIIIYNASRQERHFPPFISSISFMFWAALHVHATFIIYCNFSALERKDLKISFAFQLNNCKSTYIVHVHHLDFTHNNIQWFILKQKIRKINFWTSFSTFLGTILIL